MYTAKKKAVKTMKKVLSVLVAVLLVASACVPAFAADEIVMTPSVTEAKVGDVVTINFDIAEGYTGVTGSIKYDPNYFEYVEDSATATDLMVTELNDGIEGEIKAASAKTEPAEAGTLFSAQFKVKKVNGEFTAELEKLIDENDNDVADTVTIAPVVIAAKADESTTKASDETTTKAAEPTTKATPSSSGSKKSSNSTKNPKTGGVQVIGSAAAVLVASAFVAYTMKKKIED